MNISIQLTQRGVAFFLYEAELKKLIREKAKAWRYHKIMNPLSWFVIIVGYIFGVYSLLAYQGEKTLLYNIFLICIVFLTLTGINLGISIIRRHWQRKRNWQITVEESKNKAGAEQDKTGLANLQGENSSFHSDAADNDDNKGSISLQNDANQNEQRRAEPIEWKEAKELSGEVIIPDCMTEIRDRLFCGNNTITSVSVPGTVKQIREFAFYNCTNLQRVTLAEGVEEIERNAFMKCVQLKWVVCPDSLIKHTGWAFYGSGLEQPLTNISGTRLIYCPGSVSRKSWVVPKAVKVIGTHAFSRQEALEEIQLPDGLEEIQAFAFSECGLVEIVIPASVKHVHNSAFFECKQLERVTLLCKKTSIVPGAFSHCPALKEIRSEWELKPDEELHMRGVPFLKANASVRGNLDHTSDPLFVLLTSRCDRSDAKAMSALANLFDEWSRKPEASPFYERAANYWRYRAYQRGELTAKTWFEAWFAANPEERLEAIMPEYEDETMNLYTYSLNGGVLNDLGYSFFDPDRDYSLQSLPGEGIVEASSFESYEGPDEDGFGAEVYYDWWYLDENLRPIPGIECINATHRDKRVFPRRFDEALSVAREYVATQRMTRRI